MEKTTSRWGWERSNSSSSNNNNSCAAIAIAIENSTNGVLTAHASAKLGLDFPCQGSSSNYEGFVSRGERQHEVIVPGVPGVRSEHEVIVPALNCLGLLKQFDETK